MARARHQPSPETRAQVEALSGYGVRQDEIAVYLQIDAKTLRKHYQNEISLGHIKANIGVTRALHKNATDGNVTAQIFWLKARAGWRDRPDDNYGEQEALAPLTITIERKDASITE